MEKTKMMSANELAEILAEELRSLSQTDVVDRNIGKKIDRAKQVFNGAGKLIALASLSLEANRMGVKQDILELPENSEQIISQK